MASEFKDFAMRGSVVDMAVAIVTARAVEVRGFFSTR